MLKNAPFWLLAPGAFFWLERGESQSLKEIVERWQRALALRPEPGEGSVSKDQLLCGRYLAVLGMAGAVFAYLAPAFVIAIIVGLRVTFGDTGYNHTDRVLMKVGLTLVSALVGLILPLSTKAMIAQAEWKRFAKLATQDQVDFVPKRCSRPGNIDLLLAIPGFLLFASIWWGR